MNWLDNPSIALPIIGFIGLCFGSFISLISYRMPRDMAWAATRSQCPSCKTLLTLRDLIPVLSFLLARASCRHCKAKLSWRYPLIEIITGASFIWMYYYTTDLAELVILCGLMVCIIALIVTDFEHYIIPDELQIAMGALGIAYAAVVERPLDELLLAALIGAAAGTTLLLGFRHLRHKEGLGWGDVKFLAVAGIWLGAKPLLPFLFYAGILGILTSLFWRLVSKSERFPFGPALAVSMLFCLLYPWLSEAFWQIDRIILRP